MVFDWRGSRSSRKWIFLGFSDRMQPSSAFFSCLSLSSNCIHVVVVETVKHKDKWALTTHLLDIVVVLWNRQGVAAAPALLAPVANIKVSWLSRLPHIIKKSSGSMVISCRSRTYFFLFDAGMWIITLFLTRFPTFLLDPKNCFHIKVC